VLETPVARQKVQLPRSPSWPPNDRPWHWRPFVEGERLLRILARVTSDGGPEPAVARVCALSVDLAGVTGAGIMLMPEDVPWGSLCTTDQVSATVEDLQFALGEGPCLDAHLDDRPVLEPDLAAPARLRWPAFTAPAVEAGVRAVFGFPLQLGAVRLGALNLYRDRPGPLSDDQHADTLMLAGLAAHAVILTQAGAPPGRLADELAATADFHIVVHQASGMVSVQLGVDVSEALVRLRAYAFGHELVLRDVAHDVVARRLRFTDSGDQPETQP